MTVCGQIPAFTDAVRHSGQIPAFTDAVTAYRLRMILALLILLAIAGNAFAAKTPDIKERNIYQLFMRTNPKLQPASATKYVNHIMDAAKKYKQDPYVIAAMIVHESTVNYKAVSKGGDYGLMQVRWKVHEKAIKQEYPKIRKAADFFDPRTNIFFGTRILSECAAKSKNLHGALLRYSGGGEKITLKVLNTVKQLYASEKSSGKSSSEDNNKPDSGTKPRKKRSFLDRLLGRNK